VNRRGTHHLLTIGGELRRTFVNHLIASDIFGTQVDESHPSTKLGFYVQDQLTLRRWLLLNAGVRLDYDNAFGSSLTPRARLAHRPTPACISRTQARPLRMVSRQNSRDAGRTG